MLTSDTRRLIIQQVSTEKDTTWTFSCCLSFYKEHLYIRKCKKLKVKIK